jgi:hypothetical protein
MIDVSVDEVLIIVDANVRWRLGLSFEDRPAFSAGRRSLLFEPLGAVRPFDRMIRPDQALRIEGRPGAYGDVTGQLAFGKFAFVYVELNRRSRLSNRRVLLLPLARGRFRHAPIGPGEIWCARLSLREPREGKCGERSYYRNEREVLEHWSFLSV